MPYRKTIAAAYDAGVEEEYRRLVETPLREAEFQLIRELMDEYIPAGATVIDIGAGPGRYTEHLLERGCRVGLVDLSERSLTAFSERVDETAHRENILFNRVSCATELDWIETASADAVLLMGPLYHLINEHHRAQALRHCQRILKPGGALFAVFLSPYPVLQLGTESERERLTNGVTYTTFQGYEVPQYRCWPSDAAMLMEQHGFDTLRIRNLEGIGAFMTEDELKCIFTPEQKVAFFAALRSASEDPDRLGVTHQFLYVGQPKSATSSLSDKNFSDDWYDGSTDSPEEIGKCG